MKPLVLAPFVAFLWSSPERAVFSDQLERFDLDGNGEVSPAELARCSDGVSFSAIDQDRSGAIDSVELGTWLRATPPRPVDARGAPRAEGASATGLDLRGAVELGLFGGLIGGVCMGFGLERLRKKR